MGFFDSVSPPASEALAAIGSISLDRRTGEIPVEMEVDAEAGAASGQFEQVIEDDNYELVEDEPDPIAAPIASPQPPLAAPQPPHAAMPLLASTPTLAGDADFGPAADVTLASDALGPTPSLGGPMVTGLGGPIVPDLGPPSMPPTAANSGPVVTSPSTGSFSGFDELSTTKPVLTPGPSAPATQQLATAPANPLPSLAHSADLGATLPALESIPSQPHTLPPLEDMPPAQPVLASPPAPTSTELPGLAVDAGPLGAIVTQEQRAATLQQAISSELTDEFGAPPPAQPRSASATPGKSPLSSDDGIMVFVPDEPISEGSIGEEPATDSPSPRPAAPPPSDPPPAGGEPVERLRVPTHRVAAGHGVARKSSATTGAGGSIGKILLLVGIPVVIVIAVVVVLVVLK